MSFHVFIVFLCLGIPVGQGRLGRQRTGGVQPPEPTLCSMGVPVKGHRPRRAVCGVYRRTSLFPRSAPTILPEEENSIRLPFWQVFI